MINGSTHYVMHSFAVFTHDTSYFKRVTGAKVFDFSANMLHMKRVNINKIDFVVVNIFAYSSANYYLQLRKFFKKFLTRVPIIFLCARGNSQGLACGIAVISGICLQRVRELLLVNQQMFAEKIVQCASGIFSR